MRSMSLCTPVCLTTVFLLFSNGSPAQGQSHVADTPAVQPQSSIEFHLQKDPLRASLLNLIPFGVGSFQQGDPIASTGLLITDLVSTGLITYTFLSAHTRSYDQNMALFGWGVAGLAGGRLAGVIAPSLHYQDEMKKHQMAYDTFPHPMISTRSSLSLVSYQLSF